MEIIPIDENIIKLHILFLEKIEILKEEERRYFLESLEKFQNRILVIPPEKMN